MQNFQMTQQQQKFGAHELMEVHEVLENIINTINHYQLYRPHITDARLGQILDRQFQHTLREYDNLVSYITNQGGVSSTIYEGRVMAQTKYGLRNPASQSPNQSPQMLDDRDIASSMLCCTKATALLQISAALECADPQLRQMMIQGAVSCAEKAYEIFQYMNEKGYYQVPTLNPNTQQTLANTYQPVGQLSGTMQGYMQSGTQLEMKATPSAMRGNMEQMGFSEQNNR